MCKTGTWDTQIHFREEFIWATRRHHAQTFLFYKRGLLGQGRGA